MQNCWHIVGTKSHVAIPSSVTSIGDRAFEDCRSLETVSIPSSVTSIGICAFSGCESLESITIPSSVTSIGDYAFWGCSSLKSIVIPSSVTSIGSRVFKYCVSLESIIIPEDSIEQFKVILPRFWWDNLYYLKKAVDISLKVSAGPAPDELFDELF